MQPNLLNSNYQVKNIYRPKQLNLSYNDKQNKPLPYGFHALYANPSKYLQQPVPNMQDVQKYYNATKDRNYYEGNHPDVVITQAIRDEQRAEQQAEIESYEPNVVVQVNPQQKQEVVQTSQAMIDDAYKIEQTLILFKEKLSYLRLPQNVKDEMIKQKYTELLHQAKLTNVDVSKLKDPEGKPLSTMQQVGLMMNPAGGVQTTGAVVSGPISSEPESKTGMKTTDALRPTKQTATAGQPLHAPNAEAVNDVILEKITNKMSTIKGKQAIKDFANEQSNEFDEAEKEYEKKYILSQLAKGRKLPDILKELGKTWKQVKQLPEGKQPRHLKSDLLKELEQTGFKLNLIKKVLTKKVLDKINNNEKLTIKDIPTTLLDNDILRNAINKIIVNKNMKNYKNF